MTTKQFSVLALAVLSAAVIVLPACGSVEQAWPGNGWDFKFKDFLIAGWWQPQVTDTEYKWYRKCGFNVVMSGRSDLPDACFRLAEKHDLKVIVFTDTGSPVKWGPDMKFEAEVPGAGWRRAPLSELEWLQERYGREKALIGYMIGDDIDKENIPYYKMVEKIAYYKKNAPEMLPFICTHRAGTPEELAIQDNPILCPQIYPTLYNTDQTPADQCKEYCRLLQLGRTVCEKHHMVFWPMMNVCGKEEPLRNDSLIRFQAYASLAYGAQGLWYFHYRVLTKPGYIFKPIETDEEMQTALEPEWHTVGHINSRIAQWGKQLMGRRCAGAFHTGWETEKSVKPAPGKLIKSMSDNLLVGILTKPGAKPLAMVVNKVLDKTYAGGQDRVVEIHFAEAVKGVSPMEKSAAYRWNSGVLKLALPSGSGQLVELSGQGLDKLCAEVEK